MVATMDSLKYGRVPVATGDPSSPFKMFLFPSKKKFCSLYKASVRPETLDRYYEILSLRVKGATLVESGKPHGITKQAVRQIEAKFIRLFGESLLQSKSSSMPETL
jgi:hypothetical protein